METDPTMGRVELQKIREMAWGLIHGSTKAEFFSSSKEVRKDATSFGYLSHGFRNAADSLAEIALEAWPNRTYLLFPLAFLYRHSLELRLKAIFSETYSSTFPRSHRLSELWILCRERIVQSGAIDEDEIAITEIDKVIGHFDEFDATSQTFRYPQGSLPSTDSVQIDLKNLVYFMEVLSMAIDYIEEQICFFRNELGSNI